MTERRLAWAVTAALVALISCATPPEGDPVPAPPVGQAAEVGVAPEHAPAADGPPDSVVRAPDPLPASPPPLPVQSPRRDFAAADAAIRQAIARGVTPGAVLAVGGRDGVEYLRGYGNLDYGAGATAAADSSIYDLASLTKVMATTTAVMLLVAEGRVGLDDPLHRHLPAWPEGGWRDQVTVRRLLTHSAGFVPFVRFWHPSAGALRGGDAVLKAIVALPSAYSPGSRVTYSDLGFILLGAMVEDVTGQTLDAFLAPVWEQLAMGDTGFNPRDRWPLDRIAPTEVDTVFRHAHVHGVVHDENAYAMGGVAGHAGLFSSARDAARFAYHLLRTLDPEQPGTLPVSAATARTFTTRQPGTQRALGWDAAPGSNNIGRAFSGRAFGHTGFTGTSLWVDPDHDLFVVLLTNRVNPTREGTGIAELRRTVHDVLSD